MPGASGSTPSTLVDTSLFALSSRASASKEAKEFMEFLTQDQQVQQELFRQSQGTSVLPSVVNSSESRDLLKADDFGVDSLTNRTLDQIMKKAVLSTPGNLPDDIWDRLDYLIHNALKAKDIDNQLPQIQKIIEEMLREKFR
jgi:sugar-binding cell envelope protein